MPSVTPAEISEDKMAKILKAAGLELEAIIYDRQNIMPTVIARKGEQRTPTAK
jgi:hypothetical protein